jgi:lipid A 3-O-deacylase
MITLIMCSAITLSSAAELELPDCDFSRDADFTFNLEPASEPDEPALALIQDETETPSTFGQAGSAYWLAIAAAASDLESDHFGRAGLGVSYFMADDISLDFELNFGYYRSRGGDALGGAFSILMRWHFWRADDRSWTVYVDGGAGMLVTTDEVPRGGSDFNFTPQAGLGASWDIGDNRRLFLGARWHHISNARIYSNNPGQDHGMIYVMLGWPF